MEITINGNTVKGSAKDLAALIAAVDAAAEVAADTFDYQSG